MDNILSKKTFSVLVAALGLFCAMPAVHAAAVTYNFTIIGDVQLGEETTFPNEYNLSDGDTITATGTFTADLGTIGNETGTVLFSVSGNTMTIDLNGTILDETDHDTGSGPYLTFASGSLFDFSYNKTTSSPIFFSSFLIFDNTDFMVGEWRSNVSLTPVPVPAAVWLFGSGLLALAGIARSKKL